ncbi:MAG: DNA-3-methyladenine glycosylase I [Chloroflexi bacterium]|nr:DNA-3-methyladenine glycosylase I [Chloroflexota bacterium]
MQAPERIEPTRLGDYLEVMSKSVFQTGISWRVVTNKWPGIRDALKDFDAEAVANLTPVELDDLLQDTRVIRNRRKIEAIVTNAQRMLELESRHGSFRSYLRSHSDFDATIKDLRKQFKFLGDMGAYHFLYVVNEEVPPYEEFCGARGIPVPEGMRGH